MIQVNVDAYKGKPSSRGGKRLDSDPRRLGSTDYWDLRRVLRGKRSFAFAAVEKLDYCRKDHVLCDRGSWI